MELHKCINENIQSGNLKLLVFTRNLVKNTNFNLGIVNVTQD